LLRQNNRNDLANRKECNSMATSSLQHSREDAADNGKQKGQKKLQQKEEAGRPSRPESTSKLDDIDKSSHTYSRSDHPTDLPVLRRQACRMCSSE
jgi:hypothetical protein